MSPAPTPTGPDELDATRGNGGARQPADLEPDVERLHRAIAREPRDPQEGREPPPWWLWAGAILAIFWGGWYLGRYGGTFDTSTHIALGAREPTTAREAAEKQATAAADPVEAGRQIYLARCQACHQADGKGLPGAFPPLVGSEWVTGAPEVVVHILLHGMQGPVQVAGQTYNGLMPGWRDQLSDREIAAVATYIRQWPPNAAPPVDSGLVAARRAATAQRALPWTADEVRQATAGGAQR
jgi:mono/diheme cytochrome c family protein